MDQEEFLIRPYGALQFYLKNIRARFEGNSVLMITASHQTFSGQFRCLFDQTQFDQTHLLYIIMASHYIDKR